MKPFTCLLIFIVTYLFVVSAANGRQILVRLRPVTRKQYESIINIKNGNTPKPEGRIISSAITGLTGLATGLGIANFLPNIFGSNNQNNKSSTAFGDYPLCTIDTNDVNGRQNNAASYQIANSIAQSREGTNNLPILNCILVLDDRQDMPIDEPLFPELPDDLEEPEEPEDSNGKPTKRPTYPYPSFNPPVPYPPFYYPYYPYSPPAYPRHAYYPMPHPAYVNYPIYDKEDETKKDEETTPSPDSTLDFQTLIMNKLQAIEGLTTTTTTKKPKRKPTRRFRRRPAFRSNSRSASRSVYSTLHSKSQKKKFNDNLDKYDDSFDYIEVSRHL